MKERVGQHERQIEQFRRAVFHELQRFKVDLTCFWSELAAIHETKNSNTDRSLLVAAKSPPLRQQLSHCSDGVTAWECRDGCANTLMIILVTDGNFFGGFGGESKSNNRLQRGKEGVHRSVF
jgi:hypothetical protein